MPLHTEVNFMALTAAEQLLIEMVNRARLDPWGEARRYELADLNEGLSSDQISGRALQVVAPNELLHQSSEAHSLWMLATDTFSHTGENGNSPTDRIRDAGYALSTPWITGENLAVVASTTGIDLSAAILTHHEGLFLSAGHRANLLNSTFREIGVAQVEGPYSASGRTFNSTSMLTENFAASGAEVFLTGVVYDDTDKNAFYSIGEGRAGLRFSAQGYAETSLSAGGYALKVEPGADVSVTLALASGPAKIRIDLSNGNAKLDVVDAQLLKTSADLTLVSGVTEAELIGITNSSLTGAAADEHLTGNKGNNHIAGAGGNDKLFGGDGFDRLDGGAGNDSITGGNGRDTAFMGAGADTFFDNGQGGINGRDTVYGNQGNDTIQGGNGDDVFYGQLGNDRIFGRLGNDKLFGGDGFDRLDGGAGNDSITGGNGRDTVFMGKGNDRFTDNAQGGANGADNVFAGAGNDTIQGGNGDDIFRGELGDDLIFGRLGDDTLIGGAGNDTLDGGAGGDTFVFGAGFGTDLVNGYLKGSDALHLDDALWAGVLTAAQVVAQFGDDSTGTVVFDFGAGNLFTLNGVASLAGIDSDLVIG